MPNIESQSFFTNKIVMPVGIVANVVNYYAGKIALGRMLKFDGRHVERHIDMYTGYFPTMVRPVDSQNLSVRQQRFLLNDPVFQGKNLYVMTACCLLQKPKSWPVRKLFALAARFVAEPQREEFLAKNCFKEMARERQFFVTAAQLDKLSVAPPDEVAQRGDGRSVLSPYGFDAGTLGQYWGNNVLRIQTFKPKYDYQMADTVHHYVARGKIDRSFVAGFMAKL